MAAGSGVQPPRRIARVRILSPSNERLKNGPLQGNLAPIVEEMGKITNSAAVHSNPKKSTDKPKLEKPTNLKTEELNLVSDGESDNDEVIAAGESPAEKLLKQQELELQQQKNRQQQLVSDNNPATHEAAQSMSNPQVSHALGWEASPPETPKGNNS